MLVSAQLENIVTVDLPAFLSLFDSAHELLHFVEICGDGTVGGMELAPNSKHEQKLLSHWFGDTF